MKLIVAPTEYKGRDRIRLFMGGGISNCTVWQDTFARYFADQPDDVVLVNPRRDDFDVTNKAMEEQQIKWEFEQLRHCNRVCFWFPCETLCPITLFELGDMLHSSKAKVFVGCHPDYKRKRDVKIQVALRRPEIVVVPSIKQLALQVKASF